MASWRHVAARLQQNVLNEEFQMPRMRSNKAVALAVCGMLLLSVSTPGVAQDGEPRTGKQINWQEYMVSAGLVSAIAAAISYVDDCSKPLVIEEWRRSKGKRDLVFNCYGSEDEEGSSILSNQRFGTSPWLPAGFKFAG